MIQEAYVNDKTAYLVMGKDAIRLVFSVVRKKSTNSVGNFGISSHSLTLEYSSR